MNSAPLYIGKCSRVRFPPPPFLFFRETDAMLGQLPGQLPGQLVRLSYQMGLAVFFLSPFVSKNTNEASELI
jgi:hypothetical protein